VALGQAAFNLSMPKLGITACTLGVRGKYQVANAALASTAAHWYLHQKSIADAPQHIATGLRTAHWPGRMQVLREQPLVILDCAHNPHGCTALLECLHEMRPGRWIVAFGALADKNVAEMIAMLQPIAEELWYVQPSNARAATRDDVTRMLPGIQMHKHFASAQALVNHITQSWGDPRPLIIAGSCYLAGDVLQAWHGQRRDARGDDPVRLQ